MAEDWRSDRGLARRGRRRAAALGSSAHEVEEEARGRLGERIVDQRQRGARLPLCRRPRARRARLNRSSVRCSRPTGMQGTSRLDRWHHEEQRWEDASVPLPTTAAEEQVEHERLEQEETAESAGHGPCHLGSEDRACRRITTRAPSQSDSNMKGHASRARAGTTCSSERDNEDDARELAQQLKDELPEERPFTSSRAAGPPGSRCRATRSPCSAGSPADPRIWQDAPKSRRLTNHTAGGR